MARHGGQREPLLLAVVVLSAVIVVADIITLNMVGDIDGWWTLAVPVGLLVVPVVGVICLILLIGQRHRDRRTA